MKILHIATDNKFIDHAFPIFEKVFPGANDVYIFTTRRSLKNVSLTPNYVKTNCGRLLLSPKLARSAYEKYDVVVFHSFGPLTYPELKKIPKETATIWIGWGFDYYGDLLSTITLHLRKTRELDASFKCNKLKKRIIGIVKDAIRNFQLHTKKIPAIERLSVFAPVLPEEYEWVNCSRNWKVFPEYMRWNYGTMEDNFIRGFEGESVSGDAILVGNSAVSTGNHAEAFELLHKLDVNDRQVVAPLSYGDAELAKALANAGFEYFAENFEPLMDLMPIEEYVGTIKKCGYVIMNHVRQQGVGNIVIMLYLGARVFVRRENPVYGFFKRSGIALSTVQELETNPSLLNIHLTDDERSSNRVLVTDYWSRDKACERTRRLVDKAISVQEFRNSRFSIGPYQ